MFERFSTPALKTIMLAQEEARRLKHNFVGTEMLLLGLIGEGSSGAAQAFKSMALNLKDARIEVKKIIGQGAGNVPAEIPLTPRAMRAIEMSWTEAQTLGHNFIGPEHLLLGLIRDAHDCPDDQGRLSAAARVLAARGIDLEVLRKNVVEPIASIAHNPTVLNDSASAVYRKELFSNHSEDTIKAIMLAQEEARRLGHTSAGSEQLLAGLMAEGTNVAAKVLKSKGLTLTATRIEVEKIIGRGSGFVPVEIPLTPRAQTVLTLAATAAKQLGHSYVCGGHLLLGILSAGGGVAAIALENFGLDLNDLGANVLEALNEQQ